MASFGANDYINVNTFKRSLKNAYGDETLVRRVSQLVNESWKRFMPREARTATRDIAKATIINPRAQSREVWEYFLANDQIRSIVIWNTVAAPIRERKMIARVFVPE